ncbi:hypothetical protein T01_11985 [Trichinella spiralis]|uniref:Uncharacterized protein n=1 Tax=Trichinella spiralis TaxID=6334 RepID=A0A0V1AQS5_TRISP|nr:hypothetical protein T01_11985 [Trichinella spiralis]
MTATPPRKQSYEMHIVLSLAVLNKVLSLTLPLSTPVQDSRLDSKSGECFCVILEAAEKLYSDLIPLPRNIFRQMNRSIDPKENREYYPLRVLKTFLEKFFDKLLPHRNNAMPLSALICPFPSVRFKPIRKFDDHQVKIYRRPKRATQLTRLMLLHCAQTIITRWYPYSYRFSLLSQSPQPAQNEALLQ